ncbi:MAG: ceramidase domain-containing protein [Pseudomonadota bacterium]
MEWTRKIDGYCERLNFEYWAEPINAVTNIAFIIAALIMWRRTAGLPLGRILSALVGAIGVGSFLFHTHATIWAVTADVVPIALFTLVFLFSLLFHICNFSLAWSLVGTVAFIPYSITFVSLFNLLPFFEISAGYWPIPLLIFVVAFFLRNRENPTAIGLALGATLLCISIAIRSLDELICASVPIGSHFIWHVLNGVMLGWMIEVYRRHMLAGQAAER